MQALRGLNFGLGATIPVILQTEASECGLACLAMIASHHGHHTDLPELRKRFPVTLKGATLEQVAAIADHLGFTTRAVRAELEELPQLQQPAILHWNLNHFVVLKQVRGNEVTILDPGHGELKLTMAQVSTHFTGVALELVPGMTFQRKSPPPPVRLGELMGKVVGLRRGMLQIFVLAVVLEALSLLSPIIVQWITDDAVVTGDRNLLTMLAMGLLCLGLASTLVSAARSWIGMYISTTFNLQWMSNVMGHLLRLPIEYFEKRHLGDIVSRFGAVRNIEYALTSASIDALLDGLLALGTLTMMMLYGPKLACVSLVVVALYGLLRWARYGSVRLAASGSLVKQAKEQTYFLETIRGVRSIRLFGRERERRAAWLNYWIDATNATLTTQKLTLLFSTGWGVLSNVERALVLWLAATQVLDHTMTLGMLFAYIGYKEQFTGRVNQLIDRYIDFRMLSVQGERLADIVLTAPEEKSAYREHPLPETYALELRKLSYRYGKEEAPILDNAALTIRDGECIAIVGPSGCGKTTCLKLMLGILKPNNGSILIGGVPIQQIGLRRYRSLVATVLQDDQLFSGSLYDNIAFLDPRPDEAWLETCARTAQIHDDIKAMPMGYHTLVGDMGTVLSGGQKQRVLLARALYRRPHILFMDEATSHLDVDNEQKIGEAIAGLNITRIMIAHRPQTIAIADRVIQLQGGRFKELAVNKDNSVNTCIDKNDSEENFSISG